MKIRTGFVSNSSSSSFMIGIAKIEDRDKFDSWLKDNDDIKVCSDSPFSHDALKICKVKDVHEYYKKSDRITVESFLYGDASILLDKLNEEDELAIFDYIGDEGDGQFQFGHERYDYECDYDIDLDFFDKEYQDTFNGLSKENGLSMISKTYGAGRNG